MQVLKASASDLFRTPAKKVAVLVERVLSERTRTSGFNAANEEMRPGIKRAVIDPAKYSNCASNAGLDCQALS